MPRPVFSVEEMKHYLAWERENKWGLRSKALYLCGAVLMFLSGRSDGSPAAVLGAVSFVCVLSALAALFFSVSEYPGDDAPKRYYAYSFALFLLLATLCNPLMA